MSDNTVINTGHGGDTIATDDIGGVKFQRVKLAIGADGVYDGDVSASNGLPVAPANIVGKFRDAFESFVNGVNWTLVQDANDIVQLDGNAVSASYLVISKDPLSVGGVTTLETIAAYSMPLEVAVGLAFSQRILGQELSVELISTETPSSPVNDVAISSISQTTTVLTVNTATPHDLVPGKRIGIYGCIDSRLNYPALVVATTPSATQFTCTAGPGGTIPSVSLSGGADGYVYFRSALGYAQNGVSQIFENTSTTNASMYSRSASGDALPSGTTGGNHAITVGSAASIQSIVSPYTYSFLPTSEFRFILQADRVQWLDATVDTTSAPTSRLLRTQVVPDPTKQYKLRFRFTNNKGLTVPAAKIVSAVKSGSTTATITTDGPHGLTTGNTVVVYGIRDQTNFANLTAPTTATVLNSTQFTVAFGASATATSYGGMVAVGNGANVPTAFPSLALQSASVASNELSLSASANWSWLIGDYVNVYGCRDVVSGADLGVDGVYRVVDVSTTSIRLAPINPATTLPALSPTSCGGTVIKRTDARIAFVRIFDYLRERVEVQPNGVAAASVPVFMNGGSISSGSITPLNNNAYSLLTSTNLGAGATYTGSTTNAAASTTSGTTYFTAINVSIVHTAGQTPGTLIFEVGSETTSTTPTTWFAQFIVPVNSSANWQTFTFPLTSRYYRLRFVNGAAAQTVFRLATMSIYNGAFSSELTFPDPHFIQISTTTIGANGVQTSAALDFGDTNRLYKQVMFTAYSDQASATNGFVIQQSRDNTNWRQTNQATVAAGTLTTITSDLVYRYVRVVYTNGSVAQTSFQLDCQAIT
jgi:hypothetical protein